MAGLGPCVCAKKAGSHPPSDGLEGCSASRLETGLRAKGTAGRGDFVLEGPGGAAYTHASSRKPRLLRGRAAIICPLSISFAKLKQEGLPEGRIPTLLTVR